MILSASTHRHSHTEIILEWDEINLVVDARFALETSK